MKISHIEPVKLVEGLDRNHSRSYRLWESAGHAILKEYQIDPKLIPQLFQEIEAGLLADPTGANRTMLGKGKDTAAAVNKAYEDLKDKVYNSKPMANFAAAYDKKAAELKTATGGDQGVMKYIQKYRDFAEKHPILHGAVYAILIAALGLSGAGLGGAALLGLLKLSDQLLQGKDIRSATWSGAKTGAMAYAASSLLGGPKPADIGNQQFPTNPDIGQHVPSGPGGGVTDYVVQPGDTRSDLAKRFGSSVKDIELANNPTTYTSDHNPDLDPFTNVDPMGGYTGPQDFDVTATKGATPNPDRLDVGQHLKMPTNTGNSVYQDNIGLAQNTTDRIAAGEVPDDIISRQQQAKWDALAKAGVDTAQSGAEGAAGGVPQAIANRAAAAADSDVAASAISGATNTGSNAASAMASQSAHPGVAMFPELETDQMANDSIRKIADKIASGSLTKAEMDHLQATQSWIRAQISDAGYQNAPKEFWSYHDLLDKMTRAADNIPVKESRSLYIDPKETVRMWALKESLGRRRGGLRLTEAGVQRLFTLVEKQALNEGIMDTLKGAAGKIGNKLKQTGKNLTNKVTADKLNKAWAKAGSSPDSEVITKMILDMGVPQPIIDAAFAKLGIKDPGAATGADAAKDAGVPGGLAGASQGPAAAGGSQFVKDLVAGYMALSAADRAEIMKELDIAIDVSSNSNLVKGMNENKRRKKKAVQ